jgi:CRISPR system Cascade subunit CasC
LPGFPAEHQGIRTKKLLQLLRDELTQRGRPQDDADARIETALAAAGLKLKDDGKTECLLFLGRQEIAGFAELVDQHWDALTPAAGSGEKKSKKDAKASVPPEVQKQAKAIMNGGKAVDVALFGRMLADMPEVNQDAACQVAHALSTHKVDRDFDYFTAVDDRGDADETGAGMIGQVEFNSATFYRYAVIDPAKLAANLQGDHALALAGIKAFVEANARAIPTGKQNTFAAHNAPSFIGIALRHASPLNLANAFESPIYPRHGESLTGQSVAKLAAYEEKLSGVYGDSRDRWAYIDLTEAWPAGKGEAQPGLAALADWVVAQLDGKLER